MSAGISNELGIVIIGRNEGARLISCLASVKSYSGGVVYVDSGSTDGSTTAAERLGASVVRLDMGQPFTAARARNEGFTALKAVRPGARFVQFVDGDCELARDWVAHASAFMAQRKDVAIVCGRRRELHPETSVYNRICDIEWNTPVGEAAACGGDSLVRVDAFEAVGGFRSQLMSGEEPELCLRLREKGWRIWRLDAEMTGHDADIRYFRQWWMRAVRGGYGFAEVSSLHRHSPYRIYGREVVRAAFWGGLLPLGIVLVALMNPAALWALLAYPLQVCRIALRRGGTSGQSWLYALLMTLGKFAELQGILRFHWRRWRGQRVELIDYKRAG